MHGKPKDRDRLAVSTRAIQPGEDVATAVDGGVRRRPSPVAGIVVSTEDRDIVLGMETLSERLLELGWRLVPVQAPPIPRVPGRRTRGKR